jgi:hypothetical protein
MQVRAPRCDHAGAWWLSVTHSGDFWLVCLAAIVAELYLTRQLAREWSWEAGLRWWWSR